MLQITSAALSRSAVCLQIFDDVDLLRVLLAVPDLTRDEILRVLDSTAQLAKA